MLCWSFHHEFHFLSRYRILNIFSLHLQNVAGSNLEAFHMQSFLLPTEADKKTEYGHQATCEELQKTWPQEYTTFTLTL
jgi:hypothetical protein